MTFRSRSADRLARGAVALLLGDLDLRPVDRLRRGPLADRDDVPALIGDVADVHVDQLEADLVDLLRDVLVDQAHELLAVLVDLLDRQGRDHQTQLAQDDVLRLLRTLRSSSISNRSAALFISTGSVEMPTVNVEGTFTRMLLSDSAPSSGISITSGSSD
jgi:hypothetical protein